MQRLLVLCLIALCAATPSRSETFRNPYRLPTSSDPSSVIVADLNGDGLPDIVYGDSSISPGTLHVILAQPSGIYLAAPEITLPANVTTGCRALDTNRDSIQDLVCPYMATFNASLVTFLGNGDGTFGTPRFTALPTTGGNYFNAAIFPPSDLNLDGIPDLMVLDALNQRTFVMLGDGNGGFRFTSTLNSSLPALALDVNGDGKPDLLSVEGPYVALGNGDGTFAPFKSYSQAFDYDNICTYADMDRDGHVDAVCGYVETINIDIDGATHLIILHGNPDGSFNPTPISDKVFGTHDTEYDGQGSFQYPIVVRDLNGDGILDIIAYAGDGCTVLLGQPGLTFGAPKHYAVGSLGAFTDFANQIIDLNGDHSPDLVAAGTNGVYISYGRPDGSFDTAPAYEVAQVLGHATLADLNGDGTPDIAATGDTTVQVSLGNGDGTFAPYAPLPNGGARFDTTSAYILHGDFNGDRSQDLVALGSPSSTSNQYDSYLYFGHANGTFDPPIKVPGTLILRPSSFNSTVADLNNDGRDDLLSSDPNTTVVGAYPNIYLALSNGDGTFRTITTRMPYETADGTTFNVRNSPPALADFDHDGKLDAVFGASANAYVLKGHGDGTFDFSGIALPIHSSGVSLTAGTAAVAAGDFDGDGNQDFALLYRWNSLRSDTSVLVYYGNGDGTFSTPLTAANFSHNYNSISTTDLNGDGRADLILRSTNVIADHPSLSIVHAGPHRTFTSEFNYTAGTGLGEVAALDINRDGRPDLVFANTLASSVSVLLNQNLPTVTGTLTASPEPSRIGQAFTITAAFTPSGPVASLTNPVTFSIDGRAVGSAPLANNTASISVTTALAIGTHHLTAIWLGDTNYPGVALNALHTVIGYPVTLTLTVQPVRAPVADPITYSAGVDAVNSSEPAPTGSISITDNGAPVLLSVGAIAALHWTGTRGFTPGGNHVLTLNYTGDSLHDPASKSTPFFLTPVASSIALQTSGTPVNPGQSVTFTATVTDVLPPGYNAVLTSGTVTFAGLPGGPITLPVPSTIAGNANTVTYTTNSLPPGSYTVTASFSGNPSLDPSISAPITQVVQSIASATTLTIAPNPAAANQTVTITAHVTGVASTPTGSIQFLDRNTLLATVPLTSGDATFATASLAIGTHPITAHYSGSPNNLASTSATVVETILPSDFTISVDPTSLTLVTGHHTILALNATSIGAFSDSVRFTVGTLPQYVTVAFETPALQLTAGGKTATRIYVDTDALLNYLGQSGPAPRPSRSSPGILAAFTIILLLPLASRRTRRRIPTLVAFAVAAALLLGSAGCSGMYPASAAPGTYNIQITAQGGQGPITHTLNLPLTVTK